MNILYLSAHYPSHYQLFSHRLAERGVRIFGITDQPDECLPESLRECLAGNYRVDHLSNEGQVLAGARYFQEKFGTIDRVESHLEPWLEMEAVIRQTLGIHGPKPEDIDFIRKKSRMKEVFHKAGVPAARGQIVTDVAAALAFIKGRYPAFIKPDSGVGASDTFTIRSEGELADFFARKQDYPYFLEEYLSGVIESFDGLTDREGNVVFCTGHVFSNDIHKVVKNNENLWYYSFRELPKDLEKLGREVVKAARVREKFFHIEFFRLADGTLRALEINMRPPGGLTTHMFNFACNIDVYDWWASIMAGLPATRPFSREHHCAFVARKHDRSYAHTTDDLYQRYGDGLVLEQNMNPIEFAVMGSVGFLVRSPHLAFLKTMIQAIQQEAS